MSKTVSLKDIKLKLSKYGLPIDGKKEELQNRLASYLLSKSTIITPSDEQQYILGLIADKKNIVADCVAGSGKTTTILQIAHHFPESSILSVTYNTMLKNEVRTKVQDYGFKNITVTNYHSLAVQYYNHKAYNDEELMKIVSKNIEKIRDIPKYDIVIIDEVQDMTPLLFRFMRKFLSESEGDSSQIVIMGDKFQTLYKFKGADSRYLTLASKLYKKEFVQATLSTSFRVPRQISEFINDVMLDYDRIRSNHEGSIRYIACNPLEVAKLLVKDLQKLFLEGYQYSDVFVLNSTLRSPPMTALENELILQNIPCYFPTSDENKNKDDSDKVVFSTFHQSKGRERKIVIVYNFDDGYFAGKDLPDDDCPEELYVAVTRAKEHLWLIANSESPQLRFLNREELTYYTPFVRDMFNSEVRKACYMTSSKKIVRFLSEEVLRAISASERELVTEVESISTQINLLNKVEKEDVNDINCLAIPALYQQKVTGDCNLVLRVKDKYDELVKTKRHPFLQEAYVLQGEKNLTDIHKIIYNALLLVSMEEEVYNKVKQIKTYDWITEDQINGCFQIMDKHLTSSSENKRPLFEKPMEGKYKSEIGTVLISTSIDIMNDESIYLISTNEITIEEKLVLLFNAWIYRQNFGVYKNNYILNIRTSQLYILNTEHVEKVVDLICRDKYEKKPFMSDTKFLSLSNDTKFLSLSI